MLRSCNASIALFRVTPLVFPIIFFCTAISGAISTLYAAVFLHLLIIAAELTIGRRYAGTTIPVLIEGSSTFEESCLIGWAGLHLATLGATLYFVASADLMGRQVFAVGALFGYSINTFSAAIAHELLHRGRSRQRFAAQLLYTVMLYPQFPTVHLASHHRWAGTAHDCQTPKPHQTVHGFLVQALIGGIRTIWNPQARALDRQVGLRSLLGLLLVVAPLGFNRPALSLFLAVQGLFAFLLIETINFIQHYQPQRDGRLTDSDPDCANQDLNFVSRCLLFNLPLHAAHHERPDLTFFELTAVPTTETYQLGYWCSFWLAWFPPLWHSLQHNLRLNRG